MGINHLKAHDLAVDTEREAALAAAKDHYERRIEALRAELIVVGTSPRRRQRKVSLTDVLKQAKKAGEAVAAATVERDGRVSLTFGDAKPEPTNDLDQWMAKHYAN